MKEKKRSQKYKKYKEIENFLRDIFLAKKKKKILNFPDFGDLEKKILAKKKKFISGG